MMMKIKQNTMGFVLASALICSACSDMQELTGGIPLSGEKIAFAPSMAEEWQSGSGRSRGEAEFTGLAMEQKVLPLGGDICTSLYLHPLEVENTEGMEAFEHANGAEEKGQPSSRGSMTTGTSWTGNFAVSAVYAKDGASQSFFQNLEASKSGNIWYAGVDSQAWPTSGALSFYAYAPYAHSSLSLQGSDDVAKNKNIRYVASTSNIANQPDFIVAKSENISRTTSSVNTAVKLNFTHALTAITFSVSSDMIPGTVKSITVKNVSGQGDYDISTASWGSLATANSSYALTLNAIVKAGESKALTTSGNALMMIPQTFATGSSAQIEMVFNDGNKDRTVTASLAGTSWTAGKHITYVLSASSITTLQLGTINFPTSWSSQYTSATNKLKSAYVSGDKMGLFVVDDSKKVIAANVQLTCNGSSWSLPSGNKQKFSPKYSYFVYYPYQASLTGLPAANAAVSDVSTATAFFNSAISTWGSSKLATDQSTLDKMNACDLQIGKGTLTSDGTKIQFTGMSHAMGLADITLGSKEVENIYHIKGYETYTWKYDKTTVYAYAGFSDRSLYQVREHQYVTIVVPGTTTSFSCSSTTHADAWTEAVSVNPASNAIDPGKATSRRSTFSKEHTLAVGDIYYSDGSLSSQSEDLLSEKTPVGIVGYIGNDYWTEKEVSGKGGHALVMCLKTIGSTGTTNYGTSYAWFSSQSDAGRTKVSTGDMIRNSSSTAIGSGYTETNILVKKSAAYAAAKAAKDYMTLPANSSKCTGWFLPSAGQCYAVMKSLGGGISPDTWNIGGYFANMIMVSGNINTALSKVGVNNYTEYFQTNKCYEWTSSEYSSEGAVYVDSGGASATPGTIRFYYGPQSGKTYKWAVRPFLAF